MKIKINMLVIFECCELLNESFNWFYWCYNDFMGFEMFNNLGEKNLKKEDYLNVVVSRF